jgi:hypothetical protein
MKKQTLIAFWEYDTCPYMLGGIIKSFQDDGRIVAEGYPGMTFKPIAIIPEMAGIAALENLSCIREKYDEHERNLKIEYKNRARVNVGLAALK